MKSICMNCTFYKIEDEYSGYCRFKTPGEKNQETNAWPMVRQDHTCANWKDCGQQYYIRLGWLKAQKNATDTQA